MKWNHQSCIFNIHSCEGGRTVLGKKRERERFSRTNYISNLSHISSLSRLHSFAGRKKKKTLLIRSRCLYCTLVLHFIIEIIPYQHLLLHLIYITSRSQYTCMNVRLNIGVDHRNNIIKNWCKISIVISWCHRKKSHRDIATANHTIAVVSYNL